MDNGHAALAAAAQAAARTLADVYGLGDDVVGLDEWPVESGDSVIGVRLGGGLDGTLFLAVNDDVAGRLAEDPGVLDEGLRAAAAAITAAAVVPSPVTTGEVSMEQSAVPDAIVGVTQDGQLTALVGLSVAAPAPTPASPVVDGAGRPTAAEGVATPSSAHFAPEQFEPHGRDARSYARPLSVLHDVDLVVTAELGRATMPVRELLELAPGMVVEIDRAAGAPIDLLVNGRRIATGEVVVIDEEFGVRITEIVDAES